MNYEDIKKGFKFRCSINGTGTIYEVTKVKSDEMVDLKYKYNNEGETTKTDYSRKEIAKKIAEGQWKEETPKEPNDYKIF